jgi:hypothetical protein
MPVSYYILYIMVAVYTFEYHVFFLLCHEERMLHV